MKNLEWIKRTASDDDNVSVISSAWCRNRSGVCLSFAITMDVMDVDEIDQFCKLFIDAVNASYRSLVEQYFSPKSTKPLVCATDSGELIMLWSFQGDDDKATVEALKDASILEIK